MTLAATLRTESRSLRSENETLKALLTATAVRDTESTSPFWKRVWRWTTRSPQELAATGVIITGVFASLIWCLHATIAWIRHLPPLPRELQTSETVWTAGFWILVLASIVYYYTAKINRTDYSSRWTYRNFVFSSLLIYGGLNGLVTGFLARQGLRGYFAPLFPISLTMPITIWAVWQDVKKRRATGRWGMPQTSRREEIIAYLRKKYAAQGKAFPGDFPVPPP